MAESLLRRSKAKSIMDRSRVKKDEYVELSAEGLPEKEVEFGKPKHHGILHRTEKGIIHWVTESPEEHHFLHALAEGLRHRMSIEGGTPSERMESIGVGISHGVEKVGGGLLGFARSERERMRQQYSRAIPEAVMPSAEAEVEMPAETRAVMPSEEILICRKARKLEAVV